MCHGGVFERALVPERSHTHTCAARGLHASAPSQVCPVQRSQRELFTSIAHGVQHLGRVIWNRYFKSLCI